MKALVLAAFAALTLGGAAHAATYDFNFENGYVFGVLTTEPRKGDEQIVTRISGTALGSPILGLTIYNNADQTIYPNEDGPDNSRTPDGYLDTQGLSFYNTNQVFNLRNDGFGAADYVLTFGAGGNSSPNLTLSEVSAAPEPSTWLLMFAGIGGIGLMLRQAKRKVGFRFKDGFAA